MSEQTPIEITKEIIIALISASRLNTPEAIVKALPEIHSVVLSEYSKDPKRHEE